MFACFASTSSASLTSPCGTSQKNLWEVRKAGLNIMMSLKGDVPLTGNITIPSGAAVTLYDPDVPLACNAIGSTALNTLTLTADHANVKVGDKLYLGSPAVDTGVTVLSKSTTGAFTVTLSSAIKSDATAAFQRCTRISRSLRPICKVRSMVWHQCAVVVHAVEPSGILSTHGHRPLNFHFQSHPDILPIAGVGVGRF